jgi:hypothetical protein
MEEHILEKQAVKMWAGWSWLTFVMMVMDLQVP